MVKYKIISVFYTTHPDTVGNAIRIKILKLLDENYSLSVITNQPEFIKKYLSVDSRYIINQKYYNLSFLSNHIFWLLCGLRIFFSKYDLLFLFHDTSPVSFFNRKKPFICHIHQSHELIGIERKKSIIKRILQKINFYLLLNGIKKADFSFTVSKQLAEYLITLTIKKNKVQILPFFVDQNTSVIKQNLLEERVFTSEHPLTLIYMGWLNENRGLDIMIEGTKKLIDDGFWVKLLLIGATVEQKRQIAELIVGYEKSINVIERIPYDNLYQYLAKSNIGISLLKPIESYLLSPPQKIFEYFAMGKPVIANNIPTHTDYIKDGYNGLIIDNLDMDSFVKSVCYLFNNNDKLKEMSKNCLEYVKNFNVKNANNTLTEEINKQCKTVF